MNMKQQIWIHFAAAALTRTVDPENHVKSCTEAGKFADEMLLQFEDRFDNDRDKLSLSSIADPSFDSQDSGFRSSRSEVDFNRERTGVISRREFDGAFAQLHEKLADIASSNGAAVLAARASEANATIGSNFGNGDGYPVVVNSTLNKYDDPLNPGPSAEQIAYTAVEVPVNVAETHSTEVFTKPEAPVTDTKPSTPAAKSVAPKK